MRKPIVIGGLIVATQILAIPGAVAGPWEDGMAAYNRGDYLPAIRLFRPLAEQRHPKAQSVLGVMYRRGQGVARNSAHAFMWFSLAAKRGDGKAKADLRDLSQAMAPEEISTARAMAQACEASNYCSRAY
jgi:TPR repeat protein